MTLLQEVARLEPEEAVRVLAQAMDEHLAGIEVQENPFKVGPWEERAGGTATILAVFDSPVEIEGLMCVAMGVDSDGDMNAWTPTGLGLNGSYYNLIV